MNSTIMMIAMVTLYLTMLAGDPVGVVDRVDRVDRERWAGAGDFDASEWSVMGLVREDSSRLKERRIPSDRNNTAH